MIGASVAATSARAALQSCLESPHPSELLPLLALSVLATLTPFSALKVGSLARQVASSLAADGKAAPPAPSDGRQSERASLCKAS